MFYYFNAQDHIAGLAVAARIAFTDAVDHIHPTDHAAKDAMLSVEMRCRAKGNEELRAIGVAPGVGHAENASLIMFEGECAWLIGELVARATGSRAGGITALGHEALDHAVKRHPIIEVVARQKDEIIDGHRRLFGEKFHLEVAFIGMEHSDISLVGIDLHCWRLLVSLCHRGSSPLS